MNDPAPRPTPASEAASDTGSGRAVIDRIRSHNPTASADFLAQFSDEQLNAYLERLDLLHGRRGPRTVWPQAA